MEMSITLMIILFTCGISLWAMNDENVMGKLIFNPVAVNENKEYYRFLTSGFVHADYIHLGFNMISLYSFGSYLERSTFWDPQIFAGKGRIFYILLYALALIISEIPSYLKNKHNTSYLSLGASGAVSAVIFTFVIFYPTKNLNMYFLIPLPGYIWAVVFLLLSSFLDRYYPTNINHMAHIFGALFGLAFTIVYPKLVANYDVIERFIAMFAK